jgi:hypothetical protein
MGVAVRSASSGTISISPSATRVWVSCIGGGANGPKTTSNLPGGGGGGWGYGVVNVSSSTISYAAGGSGGNSSCLGIAGFAGSSNGSGGGFAGPSGANGGSGVNGSVGNGLDGFGGGSAGGVGGRGPYAAACTGCRFISTGAGGYTLCGTNVTGGGGNGNNGFGGTVAGAAGSTSKAGNGGSYGGGGGTVYFAIYAPCNPGDGFGAPGAVAVAWIDLSAGATTLRSGQSTTVSWNSYFDGAGSETVSYTNNGTSNITQTYTRTDSRGAQSTITFTILPAARIVSFTANPNPQTSGFDGVPNFDTILSWTTAGATSASITNIGAVSANGSVTITDLPQSVAGVTSPATRTYTLTISDGFNTATSSITVSVFNDNTPNDYSVSNQSNLEPDTFYVINLGAITGIDMVTNVVGGPGVTVSKNNLQNYVSSITIVNNDSVQLRFRSDSFNQDPAGLPTATRGLYIDIGSLRRFFTISTRAPDVNETFNLPDETGYVPYPDIDTINEPSIPYLTSDTLTVDDIELQDPSGVEIKTSNPNTQIRKKIPGSLNWGPWEDVRSI